MGQKLWCSRHSSKLPVNVIMSLLFVFPFPSTYPVHDDDQNNGKDDDDDEGQVPHWKTMVPPLKIGELVIMCGGKGDKWWVGEVLQLHDVVWDASQPNMHEGDILVRKYTGAGLKAKFKPQTKLPNTISVWSQCIDQWESKENILDIDGKILEGVKKKVGR